MKRFTAIIFTMVFALLLSASAFAAKQKVIGVSLLTRQHQFYRDLESALQASAKKNNIKLIVQAGEFDLATQMQQLEGFIVQKVDAIVVCPTDSKGIGPAVKKATKAKIPVFTADIAFEGEGVVAHIASNNILGGTKAGEFMAKILNGKGEVLVIDHPTVKSVKDRVKGFENAIKKFPGIKLVGKPSADGQRDKAVNVMEAMLKSHPNLKGVFGINDDSALGALRAIEVAKKKGIAIVGYDATEEAQKAIMRGSALKADVIQYPKKIGEKTIEAIIKYWKGEKLQKFIPVEVGVVDKPWLDKVHKLIK